MSFFSLTLVSPHACVGIYFEGKMDQRMEDAATLFETLNEVYFRDCSESTGLPLEDV